MTRLALYREFRPQCFSDVVGQEHITRTLRNALVQNRLHHAYLLSGPRGTGKTTVARVLAKAANCLDLQQGEPCNVCAACTNIMSGVTMDIIEIDAASNRGIDEIRDLREKVKYIPVDLKLKVYIIDEVHMLSEAAFNALLKTLEEPPGHVLFILATTEKHKLPITIVSRCQCFDYHRLSSQQIIDRLQTVCEIYKIHAAPDALNAIARQAEGGMRDALSLLDQVMAYSTDERITLLDTLHVLGSAPMDQFLELDARLSDGNVAKALLLLDELIRQGKDLRQFVRDYLNHMRNLLLLKVDPEGAALDLPAQAMEGMRLHAHALSQAHLLSGIKLFAQVENEIRMSTSPRLLVEVGVIRMADVFKKGSIGSSLDSADSAVVDRPVHLERTLSIERPASVGGAPADTQPSIQANASVEETGRFAQYWEQILDLVKRARPSTHTLLTQARIGSVRGRTIILVTPNSAFADLLKRPADKAIVEKAFAKVGLPDLEICPVGPDDPAGKPSGGLTKERAATGGAMGAANESLVDIVQRIFPQELVREVKEEEPI